MLDAGNHRPLGAHLWAREPLGFYVEPSWVPRRLFETEQFSGHIWDPACGIGRIPEAAYAAGYTVYASDVIDREYVRFDRALDFLQCDQPLANNIICNPPYDYVREFAEHALKLDTDAVATVCLGRRLNAARWLQTTPLARVYLLTPRPSMPPGHVIAAGEKPQGGTQDFVWLVWRRNHAGPPQLRWLLRDRSRPMSGARHRQKGARAEREIVERHKVLGIHSERYPLSGASRFRGSGHDIDIYALGRDAAPLVAEVKARKNGTGFVQLETWLGDYDALFLRRNNTDPTVVLPWKTWAALLAKVRP